MELATTEQARAFYDPVRAAEFPEHILRFRNDRHAAHVGLDGLSDAEWTRHFGRFEPLPGSLEQPLALRYHGHQFRTYNPDLGDGRGFLFAQLEADDGRLLDLGTKGSGETPYSRFGDGRLTLKGGVREVLATEMLEALGVDTSKSFSLIETGEQLHRGDEPSPTRSAVLVRLSHSHVRYGTFQRLSALDQGDNIERLTDYVLRHYVPAEGRTAQPDRYAVLIDHAVSTGARLAASFMAAGFVHGVLNTDNINITGESFDYGPYRFTPTFQPKFTAAYFDETGLYAFGRQAETLYWNVYQLAVALRTVAPEESLLPALQSFPGRFENEVIGAMFARLGIRRAGDEADLALVQALETALRETQVGLDRFYFDWFGGRRRRRSPADDIYDSAAFRQVSERIAAFQPAALPEHPYFDDEAPCSLIIDEIEMIWAAIAERDDWQPFQDKIAAIRRMGAAYGRGG